MAENKTDFVTSPEKKARQEKERKEAAKKKQHKPAENRQTK